MPVSEARVYDAAREKEREMRGKEGSEDGGPSDNRNWRVFQEDL